MNHGRAGPSTTEEVAFRGPLVDKTAERSQEFAVYAGSGAELKEVVRQQWTFGPGGSTQEKEEYRVDLRDVTVLELAITPDISGGDARASLSVWRVG